ncbi:hypothetical protein FA95DRAFT_1568150 [Auriscalpium vulgare]|uniref:Uncharacterized protein n=1 Tax=Auriscalpium vulgare TaxID=40419 RepID=A0ACB8R0N1_9AGAM|nr:hypothetical protein FA95DRAFT_1568150 [Auriscalpium vulgare]
MDVTSYTIIQSARTCILFTIIRIDPTRQMHSSLPHCARSGCSPPSRRSDAFFEERENGVQSQVDDTHEH